jgi:hypothetical protein
MSRREIKRLKILEQVKQNKLPIKEAIASLSVCERRILKRYREKGSQG